MTSEQRGIFVMPDIKGTFFFAIGCKKPRCSVIGMRHYKTKAGAMRAAEALLRRLTT